MDILEILGRIGFDWRVFLFNLVNFIIVAAILQKFFFKTVVKNIEERQRIIEEGIQNAETAKNELAMAEQKGETIIAEAKQEANAIVRKSMETAEDAAAKVKSQAETEVEQLKQKSKEQLAQERKQMLTDFRKEAADLVMLATEKLLNKTAKVSDKDAAQVLNSIEIK